MCSDLVQRLRDRGTSETNCLCGNPVCIEAADRIEELEKRVHQAKIVFATMRSEMSSVCAVMEAFESDK